jgi:amino acid adenylation domain-containing protein/non-ribosomal peptide synthase protein (TIGR01720 family)
MQLDKQAIANRFAALPAEKRQAFLQALAERGIDFSRLPIVAVAREGRLPMSYAQQRLWFLMQLGEAANAYHIPAMMHWRGILDEDVLAQSVEALGQRHESLRTTFQSGADGTAEQVIHAHMALPIERIDLRELPQKEREAHARTLADAQVRMPFDLEQGPLLRLTLMRLADDWHVLVLCMHHIVSDGWSMNLLIEELAACYRARCTGRMPELLELPELPIQYADYALWQRHWLDAGERKRQLGYWTAQLGNTHPVLELPADHARPPRQSHRGARHAFVLDEVLSDRLRGLAREQGATLFMVLLSAFMVLLHRYSGQSDVRVGVPVAGRHRRETEGLVGFFVNTQVLKTELNGRLRFNELLARVKEASLGAQAHQDLPFEQLVETLQPERSLAHNPLVQVKCTQQLPLPDKLSFPGMAIDVEGLRDQAARFDLSFDFTDAPTDVQCVFSYALDLFEHDTVAGFARALEQICTQIAQAPDGVLAELVLPHSGHSEKMARGEKTCWPASDVLRLWSDCVAVRPDAPAVRYETQVYSYAAFDRAANRLAHHLVASGVGPETRVALCVDRTPAFVLGILGIMKAGGAFVPVDRKFPPERIAMLLEDSGAEFILTEDAVALSGSAGAVHITELGVEARTWLASAVQEHIIAPDVCVHPEQAAYVIYTSGSTGRPKGVTISHGALADYVQGLMRRLNLRPDGSMAMTSTVAADLGHTVLFGALCTGRLLHLISAERAFDPDRFAEYMGQHRVDVLKIVPSHLGGLLQAARALDVLPEHALIVGGEAIHRHMLDTVRHLKPGCRIINHYGPTETAVGVLTCEDDRSNNRNGLPVGKPLPNGHAYIVDADMNFLPPGARGELLLGGAGLARGYLGRAALTAARFIPHPFEAGARLYRSGDVARRLADGNIEFLGRSDDQVKIRGYRVEPGEVAQVLRACAGVAVAEVLGVRKDAESPVQLAAYLVPSAGTACDISAIKSSLGARLPDYMVPAYWFMLDKMPLTSNGKVDRAALPKPGESASDYPADGASDHEGGESKGMKDMPRGAVEEALAALWCSVLGIEQANRNDNFFDLGGDSILSLQIIARARRQGIKLSPRQLFEHQTIARLAAVAGVMAVPAAGTAVATGAVRTATAIKAASPVPLTPVQSRFFSLDIPNRNHWNQALFIAMKRPLSPRQLTDALACLVRHHEVLRMTYRQDADGCWIQQEPASNAVPSEFLWVRDATSDAEAAAACDAVQRSLDLQHGPLLRALYLQSADAAPQLFIAIHHLAVDGVSWRLLLEDLQTAYMQLESGLQVQLPPASSSFATWARRLAMHVAAGGFDDEIGTWANQNHAADTADAAAELLRAMALPGIDIANPGRIRDAASVTVRLDHSRTHALLHEAPSTYRTRVNDLLLTALLRVMSRRTGFSDAGIELEGHGREDLFDDVDLSRSVGWFTSLFPVRLSSSGDDAGAAIKAVKEQLRRIPRNGIGFGVLGHLAAPQVRDRFGALVRPCVTFNYLGQFDHGANGSALLRPVFGMASGERDEGGPLGNALTVYGQVADGELALTWQFSSKMFDVEDVARLAADYQTELDVLIAHCLDEAAGGFTPSDVPLAGLNQAQLDQLGLPAAEVDTLYPLSPMQQGLWFHAQLSSGPVYVNQLRAMLDVPDVDRLQAAWQAVVDRHDILRSGFLQDGLDSPLQLVYRHVHLPVDQYDLRETRNPEQELATLCTRQRNEPLNLRRGPLMRLSLVRLDERRHCMLWTRHHLLLDGWSSARVLAEVCQHYAQGCIADPLPATRYRDYIGWLAGQDAQASALFWQKRLAILDEPTLLAPVAGSVAAALGSDAGFAEHGSVWDAAQTRRLEEFARSQRVTLNTLIQGAWSILLWRHTGKPSVAFGATVAGRPAALPEAERILGLFINTLPVIQRIAPSEPVGQWLRTLQETNIALREHEHTPLYDIQRWAGQGGQSLFDSIIVFENYPIDRAALNPDRAELAAEAAPSTGGPLRIERIDNEESTHYAMTLAVTHARTLAVRFGFNRACFTDTDVGRLQQRFISVLDRLIEDPQRALGAFAIGAPEEAHVAECHAMPVSPVDATPVHWLIERQAALHPDAPALIFGDERLSYRELEQRANQLAHCLIERGVGPDVLVGIGLTRSADMVIGVLAVLKAGGAYVPLDPDYPQERLSYMVEHSNIPLLLTHGSIRHRFDAPARVAVMELDREPLCDLPDHAPEVSVSPEHLAYAIYTSGSTGKPKGVMVRHAALGNFLSSMASQPGMNASDVLVAVTSLSFDIAALELYLPLVCGARLVVVSRELATDGPALARYLDEVGATVLQATPATWRILVETGWSGRPGLRALCGGEALPPDLASDLIERGAELWNMYGPTETTIWSALHPVRSAGIPPLGRPVANTRLCVLDAALHPAPFGMPGELYIGGDGLARGYLRRPALTAERFVPDPVGASGGRLYRTGDLARWREDGVLEYLGRMDQQVKIRGYRIEPGEIEQRLLEQDGVREAVVIARPGADGPQLVAYVVLSGTAPDAAAPAPEAINAAVLREQLQGGLPAYMVPSHLVLLDALPLTPNGKIDRKALPEPVSVERSVEVPQTETERAIAAIWQDVLGAAAVGRDDNFFALGGHSLLATRVVARIKTQMQLSVPLATLFQHNTLARFATAVDACRGVALTDQKLARLDALLAEFEGL